MLSFQAPDICAVIETSNFYQIRSKNYKYLAPETIKQKERSGSRSNKGKVKLGTSTTYTGVFIIGRILGDPPIRKAGLIGPLIRILGFPGPLNPPLGFLISDNLCLPELPQERLIVLAESRRLARFSGTATDLRGAWKGSIVARSVASTKELARVGAVGEGRRPLAHDLPQ